MKVARHLVFQIQFLHENLGISTLQYFNERLLNYTQLFASEADYIIFATLVTQQLQLISQTSSSHVKA